MPTKAEQDELREKCSWIWTTYGGHSGYVMMGPSGNAIFLPAAGYRNSSGLRNVGSDGYYWSSSLGSDSSNDAYTTSTSVRAMSVGAATAAAATVSLFAAFARSLQNLQLAPKLETMPHGIVKPPQTAAAKQIRRKTNIAQ